MLMSMATVKPMNTGARYFTGRLLFPAVNQGENHQHQYSGADSLDGGGSQRCDQGPRGFVHSHDAGVGEVFAKHHGGQLAARFTAVHAVLHLKVANERAIEKEDSQPGQHGPKKLRCPIGQ